MCLNNRAVTFGNLKNLEKILYTEIKNTLAITFGS